MGLPWRRKGVSLALRYVPPALLTFSTD